MNTKREFQYNTEGKHAQRHNAADLDDLNTKRMSNKPDFRAKRPSGNWQGTYEYEQMIAESIRQGT
ncbi:hypothetical protein AGMMS50256_38680 [Betaproteobacteria bacterium]|nr:hypothetical protein AGMMS50256_38680 [Betaproteobacteria bacterium]